MTRPCWKPSFAERARRTRKTAKQELERERIAVALLCTLKGVSLMSLIIMHAFYACDLFCLVLDVSTVSAGRQVPGRQQFNHELGLGSTRYVR
jgi:hypothetical protein